MRMDRSKQGVAPRTCLSKLPLKPRPTGPPPNSRPVGSGSPVIRNFSGPPSGRNSPAGLRGSMLPAPLSPNLNGRVQSPDPLPLQAGRQRSYSHSQNASPRGTGPQARSTNPDAPSPLKSHRRSASANQILSAHTRQQNPSSPPKGVPARKPVPGQAM